MMRMKRLSTILAASLALLGAPVSAETLDEAMRAAIEGNPSIAAERARLKAAIRWVAAPSSPPGSTSCRNRLSASPASSGSPASPASAQNTVDASPI